MSINDPLSEKIIGAAIEVHKILGPGHLESLYRECLRHELQLCGLRVQEEVWFDIHYKDYLAPNKYRADLIVEQQVLLELKAIDRLPDVARAQVLSYLKLSQLKVGLLINFNVNLLRDGVKRYVNKWQPVGGP